MSGFGIPKISSPASLLSGSGVGNVETRDLSAPDTAKMAIIPVNEPYNSNNTLIINTNSISESKSANWVKHYVPGQSDPLLQWISGSEKAISFTALVTKDIASNLTVSESDNAGVWNLVINPELYEKYANVDDVPASILESTNSTTNFIGNTFEIATVTKPSKPYWTRSIQPQLDFYRSLVIPRTGNSASFAKTPPLVYLRMGTILGNRAEVESQKFILLNYSMNITEYSPELEPTKATVSFTFVEYVPRTKTSQEQIDAGKPDTYQVDNSITSAVNRLTNR